MIRAAARAGARPSSPLVVAARPDAAPNAGGGRAADREGGVASAAASPLGGRGGGGPRRRPRQRQRFARASPSAAAASSRLLEHGRGDADDEDAVTLCVEGNIGAGKSTFLQYVARQNDEDDENGGDGNGDGDGEEDGGGGGAQQRASSAAGPGPRRRRLLVAGVPEPVHLWQAVPRGAREGPLNLLDEFYRDPQRHAFTFQSYVFLTRVLQERDSRGLPPLPPPSLPPRSSQPPPPSPSPAAAAPGDASSSSSFERVRLLERSVFSDRLVFVRAVLAEGWMGAAELAVYDAYAAAVLGLGGGGAAAAAAATTSGPGAGAKSPPLPQPPPPPPLLPDGFVYLRSRPAVCAERLARRARSEEGGVSLAYLEGLHALHEDWLLGAGVGPEGWPPGLVEAEGAAAAAAGGERAAAAAGDVSSASAASAASAAAADNRRGGTAGLKPRSLPPVPASIRAELRFLSAGSAAGGMHPALDGLPALVLDADADLDASAPGGGLQRRRRRQVGDFAAFLRAYRRARAWWAAGDDDAPGGGGRVLAGRDGAGAGAGGGGRAPSGGALEALAAASVLS